MHSHWSSPWFVTVLFMATERNKRHVLFESGHAGYPMQDFIKEVLAWLDRYLGPVRQAS